jgi:hypothetical protein
LNVPSVPVPLAAPAASAREAGEFEASQSHAPDVPAPVPPNAVTAREERARGVPARNVPAPPLPPGASAPAAFTPETEVSKFPSAPVAPPAVSNPRGATPLPTREAAPPAQPAPQARQSRSLRRPEPDFSQPPQPGSLPIPATRVLVREEEARLPGALREPEARESGEEEPPAVEALPTWGAAVETLLPAVALVPVADVAERPSPASRLPQPALPSVEMPREDRKAAAPGRAAESQPARAVSAPPLDDEPAAAEAAPDRPPVQVRALRGRRFTAPVREELAFAARVREDTAAEPPRTAPPAHRGPQAVKPAPVAQPEPAVAAPFEAPAEPVARLHTGFTVAAPVSEIRAAAADVPARPAVTPPTAAAAPEPPVVERPAAAARDISVEVAGAGGRVEIRVAEREGEIRMAVHAPRGELAGELRERLPELANRLEQGGWSAETWRPEVTAGPRSDSGTPGREGGSQHFGQEPGDSRQGRQQQDRQSRPAWLAELEETEERSEPEWQAFQAR